MGHTKGCECACGDRARDASEAPGAEKAPKYQGSPLCDPFPGNSAGAREGVDPPRVRPGLQARRARCVGTKPGLRRALGGAGKAKPNRFIWDPFPGGSQIRSVSSRPRTEVGVPGAAEVSSGCVPGPWERVGTRSLRVSWEVTHGDKKTPGNKSGDIRTPPGLGDCGSARSPFPTSPRSLSPPRRHHQHSDLFGWHRVFPGKPDTGRSKTGCPVPAPRRALWDPKPRPGAGWACASLSVREAPKPDLPLSHRCRENPGPACPWVGRTESGTGDELCSAARWGHPAPDGGGGGREGEVLCCEGWGFGVRLCSGPPSPAFGRSRRLQPSPEFPLQGRQG